MDISKLSLNIYSLHNDHTLSYRLNKLIGEGQREWIMFSFDNLFDYNETVGSTISKYIPTSDKPNSPEVLCISTISDDDRKHINLSAEYVISHYDMTVHSILIKRSIFIKTGCFNEFLGTGCIMEFLYRSSLMNLSAHCLNINPTDKNTKQNTKRPVSADPIEALAYMICHYRMHISDQSKLGNLLNYTLNKLSTLGTRDTFMLSFNHFTSDPAFFDLCMRNTAPIYVITGNYVCYGLLNHFATEIAEHLIQMGQAVLISKGDCAPVADLKEIESRPVKAFIGFQASILLNNYFRSFSAPKILFWFDDPVFSFDMFTDTGESTYLLCQDGYHAEFLNKYCNVKKAFHMAPGAEKCPIPDYINRTKDVIFIGTYTVPVSLDTTNVMANELYEYMHLHTELTYEQCVRSLLESKEISLTFSKYLELLRDLKPVYKCICDEYRERIIESIVGSGILLHVYGNSWNDYSGSGSENLIIHPSLSPSEIIPEMQQAKISLNIMSWHKNGMTERVIYSMLAGAVCLSDKTAYLQQDIIKPFVPQYDLNHLDGLSDMIRSILADDDNRISIARKAYEYAYNNETWNIKVEALLDIMRQ